MAELTEEDIDAITDLFQAFKLMQELGVSPKGVASIEDAKCRLLQYIQEKYGAGKPRRTSAADLMKDVLDRDKRNRDKLDQLYTLAMEYINKLPSSRNKELAQNIPNFVTKMEQNKDNLKKSECAILVAGEVSAGKSSLLNLLLGTELLPTSLLSCTSVMCELKHSDNKHAVAHYSDSSKRPDYVDLSFDNPGYLLSKYVHQKGERSTDFPYVRVEIFWPFPLLKGGIFIVDSPGIGESREMNELVKEFLPSAFAFIYVINSSNAGGLQPDRLQDLLAALSRREENLSVFDPRSAIFVCNKWDQVPLKEEVMVKKDTMEKLKRCWPGIEESQVFCMSTTKAKKSLLESDYITQDFSNLLDGIEKLLPISLQCKLENHYRWLSHLLRRSNFGLRVYIANETRSDEERKELTESLHSQLDKLDGQQKRVSSDLKIELHNRANVARDQLIAHLASASTRSRLMQWDEAECPDGDDWDMLHEIIISKVNKRIRREVNDWDQKNQIFMHIQRELLGRFRDEFELMEDQLGIIEGGMTARGGRPDATCMNQALRNINLGPSFSTGQKIALGLAAPVLIPLGVVAGMFFLPVAAVRAIRAKLADMKLLGEYRKNKTETLSLLTDEILENFLDKANLSKLIQEQLHTVLKNIDTMIQSIPNLIEADRIMINKLQEEREATEVSLAEQYLPMYQRCLELQGQLDLYYVDNVREYEIGMADLVWDPASPPIASGTFGDVYAAKWKRADKQTMGVAIKIRREVLDAKNVTDILIEEENLRKFRHPNIVTYHGTCPRRDAASNKLQLVMVMELCDSTLRAMITGDYALNPGRLGNNPVLLRKAVRRVARLVTQVASALVYLHARSLVHRDLKPQNILVSGEEKIKLADVGLTKPEHDISGTKCGTTCYAAPEVLEGAEYNKAADIYSLGIILWELWYGRLVQDEMASAHKGDVETAIRSGSRPSLASFCEPPDEWKVVMRMCWAHDCKERLSAEDAYAFFDNVSI